MRNITLIALFAIAVAKATSIGLFPVDDGLGTIGNAATFAVEDGSFNMKMNGMADIVLHFNYRKPGPGGPATDLGGYKYDGIHLNVGDLLIAVGDDLYGIPLKSHSGAPNGGDPSLFASVSAGHFYQTTSYLTTDTVLNFPNATYREDTPTWLGATVSDLGSLTEKINHKPDSSSYTVEFVGKLPLSFVEDVETHNALKIQFGSATCDNGKLEGGLACPVPEPLSLGLMGGGLMAFGLLGRGKKP